MRRSVDRKSIEKKRRNEMKCLCLKLVSLIPPHHFNHPKEVLTQQDQIEEAANYIQKLSGRVEQLKRRKAEAFNNIHSTTQVPDEGRALGLLPVVRVRDLGSSLEVVLISGLRKRCMVHQVIAVIEEEGAEVVTVSFSNDGDKIFHTLHAQVKIARVGVDISRICGRLEELIC